MERGIMKYYTCPVIGGVHILDDDGAVVGHPGLHPPVSEDLELSEADRAFIADDLRRRASYFIDRETKEVLYDAEITISVGEAIRLATYLEVGDFTE